MSLKDTFEPIRAINRRYGKGRELGKVARYTMTFLAWYVVCISLLISYKFYLMIGIMAAGGKMQ
ncbi:MAG: hypothetical protein HQL87_06160 [Magnetococcales bacterium]|nr:hypothetical protein [Magnetococcales bacterium]